MAKHYGGTPMEGSKERKNLYTSQKALESELLMSKAKGKDMHLNLVDERYISARINFSENKPMNTGMKAPFESTFKSNLYQQEAIDENIKENSTIKMMNLLAMKYPKRLQKLGDFSEQAERDSNILRLNIDRT